MKTKGDNLTSEPAMIRIRPLFLWPVVIGPLHMAEQLLTGIEEFYSIRALTARYYAMFDPSFADLPSVLLITIVWTTVSLLVYALLKEGTPRLVVMGLFGAFAATEVHHIIDSFMKGAYDPGVLTCVPYAAVGCLLVAAVARELTAPSTHRRHTRQRGMTLSAIATETQFASMTGACMNYDPFVRGPHPVGVCTINVNHEALANRPVAVELWYPARVRIKAATSTIAVATGPPLHRGFPGRSRAPFAAEAEPGARPLFLYLHGGYGHRREMSHLTTHLASHGYLVAAADFPGDNIVDLVPRDGAEAAVIRTPIDESARRRPRQASVFLDLLLRRHFPGAVGERRAHRDRWDVDGRVHRSRDQLHRCQGRGGVRHLSHVRDAQPRATSEASCRPPAHRWLAAPSAHLHSDGRARPVCERRRRPTALRTTRRGQAPGGGRQGRASALRRWSSDDSRTVPPGYLSGALSDPELQGSDGYSPGRSDAAVCGSPQPEEQGSRSARALCLAQLDARLGQSRDAKAFLDSDIALGFASRGIGVEHKHDAQCLA